MPMEAFTTDSIPLEKLLADVLDGRVQLPDFQRSWVWDDMRIRELLVSIVRHYPIGAILLLETGGELAFATRPLENVDLPPDARPERLILDGQQRLTALVQALALDRPVRTYDARGREVERRYFFDIERALQAADGDGELLDAIVAADGAGLVRGADGAVRYTLDSPEAQFRHGMFPVACALGLTDIDAAMWLGRWVKDHPGMLPLQLPFLERIVYPIRQYRLPVIEVQRHAPRGAVCTIFEKVNTGAVDLDVFDLVTARFAADGYRLRDDWLGTSQEPGRREKIRKAASLVGALRATEFLQAVALRHARTARQPANVRRQTLLALPLDAWRAHADAVEAGFREASAFLKLEGFYSDRDVPYRPQLVVLAAVLSFLGERWREPETLARLARWFWCGALGELFGGAVETRIAQDFDGLLRWLEGGEAPPTVAEARFEIGRLDELRSRNSAAYKAVSVLVLREGARDWLYADTVRNLDLDEVRLDIHHIFPTAWCDAQGIPKARRESILNKTHLSARANRSIGGRAPSDYLPRLQEAATVRLGDAEMDALLASHALAPALLRADDFDAFIEDRRERLAALIEAAMGWEVVRAREAPPAH